MRNKRHGYIALLAAGFALQASGDVQLLPAGQFAARDGRPGPGKKWKLDDDQGHALAAELTRTSAQTPFLFDYDHQTIHAEKNGQHAPAAGWSKTFEWRPGAGLFATQVDWTAKATAFIDAGEYRYVSPVIKWDDEGRVTGVLMASILNYPALLGMGALGAPLQAVLAGQFDDFDDDSTSQETDMSLLASLIAALGAAAHTTEADALSAVSALRATVATATDKPPVPTALSAALGLSGAPTEAAALSAVEQLKGGTKVTNDTIAALQGQLASLLSAQTAAEVDGLVNQAMLAGKLVPAMKDWAVNLGKQDIAQLRAYIDKAPALGLGQGQSGGKDPAAGGEAGGLTANQAALAARLGIDPVAYSKHLSATAAA